MNKKIKIIDIFNIISKGDYEALPLNIQVDGNKYNWDNLEHFYGREDREYEDLLELAREYDTITFLDMIAEVLDDSVEDNTEEIEELDNWFVDEKKECREFDIQAINLCFSKHRDKINELVKAVNAIRKENKK